MHVVTATLRTDWTCIHQFEGCVAGSAYDTNLIWLYILTTLLLMCVVFRSMLETAYLLNSLLSMSLDLLQFLVNVTALCFFALYVS